MASSRGEWILNLGTIVLGAAAIILAGSHILAPLLDTWNRRDREVENWRELVRQDLRVGASQPTVSIVEWGDYQCPACRRIAPLLDRLIDRYPSDVALFYRHWPLSYHEFAYDAARVAECSAVQRRFPQVHAALLRDDAWMKASASIVQVAIATGIADTTSFKECVSDPTPHPSIERDIESVLQLNSRGTPTIIVEGLLLGTVPDSTKLFQLVEERIAQARGDHR